MKLLVGLVLLCQLIAASTNANNNNASLYVHEIYSDLITEAHNQVCVSGVNTDAISVAAEKVIAVCDHVTSNVSIFTEAELEKVFQLCAIVSSKILKATMDCESFPFPPGLAGELATVIAYLVLSLNANMRMSEDMSSGVWFWCAALLVPTSYAEEMTRFSKAGAWLFPKLDIIEKTEYLKWLVDFANFDALIPANVLCLESFDHEMLGNFIDEYTKKLFDGATLESVRAAKSAHALYLLMAISINKLRPKIETITTLLTFLPCTTQYMSTLEEAQTVIKFSHHLIKVYPDEPEIINLLRPVVSNENFISLLQDVELAHEMIADVFSAIGLDVPVQITVSCGIDCFSPKKPKLKRI